MLCYLAGVLLAFPWICKVDDVEKVTGFAKELEHRAFNRTHSLRH
jgi:hypothetical protein